LDHLVSLLRRLSGIVLLLVLGATATAGATPSGGVHGQVDHRWIVSLGDSYTSGNGAGNYYGEDGRGCHRSFDSYPWRYLELLRSSGQSADIWHAACSGAQIEDLPAQVDEVLAELDPGLVDTVILTIGGNDLGFSDALPCLLDFFGQEYCANVIAAAWRDLPAVMAETEAAVRALAQRLPNADVVLVGYPKLTSPSCPSSWNAEIFRFQVALDAEQASRMRKLNRLVKGPRFLNVPTAAEFTNHGPCAFFWLEWVHDIVLDPFWESFHPNRTGHQVVANKLFSSGV
jgi:lysophospholipase L1-like esterase